MTGTIGVVIPTIEENDENILTLDSIPSQVPIQIEREGSLNEARNRGVSRLPTDLVIILDDDLRFPPELLDRIENRLDKETLIGMSDWDFGWIAGRLMAFHLDLWKDIGGFDERLGSHMGDTEFAISAWRKGYKLERLPREIIYHEPHSRSITPWDRLWRIAYLSFKHPVAAPKLAMGVVQ